jgi:hypothetical protein
MERNQSWKVRDGHEGDMDEILSLRKVVFGEMEKDKLRPEFWRWEFLEGPDGRALIYLVEEGERLIGHFADIPRRFSVNGVVVLGTLSLDLMVHPEGRRKGIFFEMGRYAGWRVKEEKGLFMTAYPIREETIWGLRKIGWKDVVRLPVIVYPIRFQAVVARYLPFSLLSFPVGGMATFFHSLIFKRKEKRREEGIVVEKAVQLDDQFDVFWQKALGLYPIMGVRDRSYLTWRYLQSPTRSYTLYRALRKGGMEGYIVLRKVDLLGWNSTVIVDLLALDEDVLSSLVDRGIQHSREEGADLLGFMLPKTHPYYRTLIRRGFLPSLKSFQFMIYDHGHRAALQDPKGWYVNWGDTDVI